MYNLNNIEMAHKEDLEIGRFSVEFLPVTHVDTIPSYGFVMKINEESFYYSGDANSISEDVISRIISGEIERAYQDTCGLDYAGNNHLFLGKLCNVVPYEFRNRFYCMHLDKHIIEAEIKSQGFNVVEVYK